MIARFRRSVILRAVVPNFVFLTVVAWILLRVTT